MFRNFFIVAGRNFLRQLYYSLINIIGLAVGIACSLVIFVYVYGEWRQTDTSRRPTIYIGWASASSTWASLRMRPICCSNICRSSSKASRRQHEFTRQTILSQ
ncbi:MAG: ABC transporter permease [Bacteroidia bacterium]|nr:ABC transporter permease [Bacteroidia bacterium]